MSGALSGLRVLDLSRVLAGPLCTMMLSDLGADVVKVERPGAGDETRTWGPPFAAAPDGTRESAYFLCTNRGKRSIAIDLARPAGLRLATRLAERADVLVENFRPGGLARLGFDVDALRATNRGLVHAALTGFGDEGPDADRPGYDALIQATAGLMSVTGAPGGEPIKVGVAVADVLAAHWLLSGILAALFHRERTGEGQRVSVALQDALVASLVNQAQSALLTGVAPRPMGSAHPNIVPYQAFRARDGWLVLAAGNDAQYRAACDALGLGELGSDPRFADNPGRVAHREELVGLLAARFATDDVAAWCERLRARDVPAGPVRDLGAVLADPQIRGRGMVRTLEHASLGPFETVASPLRLERTPPELRRAPPRLGEHGAEIVADWLALAPDAARALRDEHAFE